MSESKRARRMSRDERRNAIMDATIPLLIAHGREVTSRQIAEAAGVAEGTIYSVFDGKDELVTASVHRYVDTASMAGALAELPPNTSLSALVESIVRLTERRVTDTFALLSILRFDPATVGRKPHRQPPDHGPIIDTIAELLVPFRDQLRIPPRRAAEVIRLAAFSMTHPMLTQGNPLPAAEIADLLMHGFAVSADAAPAEGPASVPLTDTPEESFA